MPDATVQPKQTFGGHSCFEEMTVTQSIEQFIRLIGLRLGKAMVVLTMMVMAASMTGCEVNSFLFDQSKTGRFQFYPTTIPVLDRIDVIEPQQEFWSRATPPTQDDLIPRDLAYYIYPGDTLSVGIYELDQPGTWKIIPGRVDAAGNFRVPGELGDVRAAGLTAQQFEDELRKQLKEKVMTNPQVNVHIETSGGLRYTVYGFVQNTGQFNLDNPNLRLLDALANAGGVPPSTKRVYVIRQIVLDEVMRTTFDPHRTGGGVGPATRPSTTQPSIEDLLNQLENKGNTTRPAVSPGMMPQDSKGNSVDIDQLEPIRGTDNKPPPVDVDVLKPASRPAQGGADSWFYDQERGEWVRVPGKGPQNQSPSATQPLAEPSMVLDRIIEINYENLSRGDSSQNIVVHPNDRIYVEGPDQGLVYIEGEISRPGTYNLPGTGRLTLSRLISTAGGLGPIAVPTRIDLTRVVGHNLEAKIRVDLAAIRQGTEPDIIMKPDDQIIIGTDFWSTPLAIIRNGFRATYGFGFILDRNFGTDVFGVPPGGVGSGF